MSSFINTRNHFGSIYKSLLKLKNAPEKGRILTTRMREALSGFGYEYDYGVLRITIVIMQLQVECVTRQYQHHHSGNVEDSVISTMDSLMSFKDCGGPLEYPALIKAIQCMMYQIEPEHLKGVRKLSVKEAIALKFFRDLEHSLLVFCMDNTTEYQSANWCIP